MVKDVIRDSRGIDNSDKINELKQEIVRLKKEEKRALIEEALAREKALNEETYNDFPSRKKYLGILITLIVLVLLVDLISVFAYYQPSMTIRLPNIILPSFLCKCNVASNVNTSSVTKPGYCKDGTADSTCSSNKPYYCYNGELLKNANACGCPSGYIQDFQDCKVSS